jgi:glycosyltransferase involved in cell wall biosynthesis
MSVLVIIPAYNEAANIGAVLESLRRDFAEADVLVVNDCSKDETEQVVRGLGVRCVSHPFNMGYAAALQTGFKFAAAHDYTYVIQFDGDGQHIAAVARGLYETALTESCDVVLGSRFIAQTGYAHSFFRLLGTRFFSGLIRLITGRRIHDPTSGLQVINRRCYTRFARMNQYPEYPDANLLIDLIMAGAKICEVPAEMRLRTQGQSMHSGLFKPLIYMLLMCYSILIVLLRPRRQGRLPEQDLRASAGPDKAREN